MAAGESAVICLSQGSQERAEAPEPDQEAAIDAALAAEVGAKDGSDGEDDDADFDYKTLEEAQRLAGGAGSEMEGVGPAEGPQPKRKSRGGAKEAKKQKYRQKRQDEILRAKQAGIPLLRDALRAAVPKSAAPSVALPKRRSVSYADVDTTGTDVPAAASSSSSSPATVTSAAAAPATAVSDAALARLAKVSSFRARREEARNLRTVFVKNFSFKMTEQEMTEWFSAHGKVTEVMLARDKVTTKLLGYAHVRFEEVAAAQAAIQRCDRQELHGRIIRVVPVGTKCDFELPEEIKDDIRAILRGDQGQKKLVYEGMNLSTVKDTWEKCHRGQKLDTRKWGFKNFSAAVATIEGVVLENHLEKKLTNLAFFRGSPAHVRFLQEKQRREGVEDWRSMVRRKVRGLLHTAFGNKKATSNEGTEVAGRAGGKRKAPNTESQDEPPAKRQHKEEDAAPSVESGARGAEERARGCTIS